MSKQLRRLKELRQEKGISLSKLSKILKEKYDVSVSTSQLMYYEKGEREPRNKQVWEKLADYFGVSVGYLLGYDDNLTIGDTIEILEAVYAGDIPSNDEMVEKTITHQKKTDKEIQEIIEKIDSFQLKMKRGKFKRDKAIAQQAYGKYKDFDLVSNIKVLTLLLENCDNIYTDIIRYASPRIVKNELTETEFKSLNAFISLLKKQGKEFKDAADSLSKGLNTKTITPTDND